jgi:hypothetical protein
MSCPLIPTLVLCFLSALPVKFGGLMGSNPNDIGNDRVS